ncbi:hypothetical protein [Haloparvum sp. AD34]
MARATLAVVLAAVLVLSTVAFGATAFTTATVERQASIDVVSDDSGPLQFTSGGTGITEMGSNGELNIDVGLLGGTSGINPNASYTFGNASADGASSVSASDYVFTFNNTDSVNHTVQLTYTPDNSIGANNVVFEVYRLGNGTASGSLATVKAGSSDSFTAESDKTYHIIATFDTGIDGQTVDTSSTLSGTMNVSV